MHSDYITDMHYVRQTTCFICKELYWYVSLGFLLLYIIHGLGFTLRGSFIYRIPIDSSSFDVKSVVDQANLAGWLLLHVGDGCILDNSIDVVEFSRTKGSRAKRSVYVLHLKILILLRFFFLIHILPLY